MITERQQLHDHQFCACIRSGAPINPPFRATSKARFLIPAFTLLLPIAVGLARAGRARATTVVVTLAIFSAYYGGYLMMVWGRSP
ncbi:hypothetical protein [Micromonospora inyonensis]|uniref:hypothetical protein n=1 Tax=Micromonospora inyonensis TaxID=47866 RepID=UPI000B80FC1A|nr:hypothetical protein [Micromonospora inyonensis]